MESELAMILSVWEIPLTIFFLSLLFYTLKCLNFFSQMLAHKSLITEFVNQNFGIINVSGQRDDYIG